MLAWLGFIGILFDFAGVVILTLDILPEFTMHRREQRLRQLRLNTSHLRDGDGVVFGDDVDPVIRTTSGALSMVRASNASLYQTERFDHSTARAALSNCAYDFQARDDERVKTALKDPTFSRANFDSALAVLEEKAASAQGNLSNRRRPNLFWGVFFVLLGFVLQAFGAMPTYAQTFILHAIGRYLGAPV